MPSIPASPPCLGDTAPDQSDAPPTGAAIHPLALPRVHEEHRVALDNRARPYRVLTATIARAAAGDYRDLKVGVRQISEDSSDALIIIEGHKARIRLFVDHVKQAFN